MDADKDLWQQLLQLRRRESGRRWISEVLDNSSIASQPSGSSFPSLLDSVSEEGSVARFRMYLTTSTDFPQGRTITRVLASQRRLYPSTDQCG
jgi:hypothetical protein